MVELASHVLGWKKVPVVPSVTDEEKEPGQIEFTKGSRRFCT